MNVTGSSGERYSIDKKKKYVGRSYVDYQIMGSGGYIARILDRGQRKSTIEHEILDAAQSGAYYGEERPLNVLYSHGKFVGFLYEGEMVSGFQEPAESNDYREYDDSEGYAVHNDQSAFGLATQGAAMIVGIAVGIFMVYPLYISNWDKNWDQLSVVVQMLVEVNTKGILAVIAGIALQIFVFLKLKDSIDSALTLGGIGLAANLAGIIAFTLLFSLVLYILQGAISFIMKYLVVIILLAVGFSWVKKKFYRFFR